MGCFESKPIEDTKLQIPRKVPAKHVNGSVRSKHDFGVQIGTPFSKKRPHINGTLATEVEDDNENVIIAENGIIPDFGKEQEADVPVISTDIQIDDDEQPEQTTSLDERQVAEQEVAETIERDATSEGVEASVDVTPDQPETSSGSPITLQQKWLLQDSWAYVEKDLLEFGMVFFSRLLDQNPGLKHLWSFGKMNYTTEAELREDASFQDHSRRVMEMIGSAIGGLDDLELLVPILTDIGQRHRMYGAKPEHFKAVHEALIYSYEKGLEERIWTADVKDAWDTVVVTIASVMSAELTDDEPVE